jgi:hypothetical protein
MRHLSRAALVAVVLAIVPVGNGARDEHGGISEARAEATKVALSDRVGWMPSLAKPRAAVWAVGDGADGGIHGRAVAAMVGSHRVDRLLYLGDIYSNGTADEFEYYYAPVYGRFNRITAPTIGNHEWTNVTTGYLPYWAAERGSSPPLWYAFAVSGWQLISLNSNIPDSAAQLRWLDALIERTPTYGDCRIAFDHHPFFSAGTHDDPADDLNPLEPVFAELRGAVAIVLSGHDHNMQRLRPVKGVTQLIAGAGGNQLTPVNRDDPRLKFADDAHFGALRLELRPGRATLTFVAEDGTRLDRSSVACRQG